MRIFIQGHNASPDESIRQAVEVLLKAGIYSAGGAAINDRTAVILVDDANVPAAIEALNKAGMRAAIG
jgi:hypothetical protein